MMNREDGERNGHDYFNVISHCLSGVTGKTTKILRVDGLWA